MNDDKNFVLFKEFIINTIQYHGNEIYVLFVDLGIGQNDIDFMNKLFAFSYESTTSTSIDPKSMVIVQNIMTQMKEEIDMLKNGLELLKTENGFQKQIIYSNLTVVTIPPNFVTIPKGFFKDCSQLEEVKFTGNVKSIEDYAFYGCASLAYIEMPSSVVMIGDFSFHGCVSLLKITLPANLKSIGSNAFSLCPFKKIIIPPYVESIGSSAFFICDKLKQVIILSPNVSIDQHSFDLCSELDELTVSSSVDVSNIRLNYRVKILKQ